MPTYQYRCTACAEPLEVVQSFTDDPLTECPDCGGELRKVFSSVGIVFKGSGFYRTDSRAASDGAKSRSDSPKADGTKSDGAKSDGAKSSETPKSDSTKSDSTKSGSSTTKESAA